MCQENRPPDTLTPKKGFVLGKTGNNKGDQMTSVELSLKFGITGGSPLIQVTSPAAVRSIMRRHNISCRKSLGQNFLVDSNIIKKILDYAGLTPDDLVLEIGPGLGALTAQAAQKAGKVLAVEVDRGLLPALAETLEGAGDVEVIEGDALKIDFDRLVEEKTGNVFGRGGKEYKLIANLPYYITSPLLMHLLINRFNFSIAIVMVQLEVAERLSAEPGTRQYGSLSVAVQYFTESKILFKVPRTVFFPAPEVDSAVVCLSRRALPAVAVRDEETFFKVVRAAFGQRRKTLLNSLDGSGLGPDKATWLKILERSGIDGSRRGETLTLAEFAALTESYLDFNNK
jgi:16S rRNA (adenine1518-N6/adenine1519-N6)-dimethyltransferase